MGINIQVTLTCMHTKNTDKRDTGEQVMAGDSDSE